MYKVASDKRQRSLHQGRPADWVNGAEQLSVEDQLRQLQEGIRIIERRLIAATGQTRKALALQKADMAIEIAAFREKHGLQRKQMYGLDQEFVNLAKEMLSKVQFKIIMNAAKREYQKKHADNLEKPPAPLEGK